jgi:PHD/YefM family antitoxin component YafN of YafNO toxin-antitoxin module
MVQSLGMSTPSLLQNSDFHPLASFQRQTKRHLTKLKKSGRPEVLTVNGRVEAVLLAPEAYDRLVAAAYELDTIKILRRSLSEMARGETTPAETVHQRLMAL